MGRARWRKLARIFWSCRIPAARSIEAVGGYCPCWVPRDHRAADSTTYVHDLTPATCRLQAYVLRTYSAKLERIMRGFLAARVFKSWRKLLPSFVVSWRITRGPQRCLQKSLPSSTRDTQFSLLLWVSPISQGCTFICTPRTFPRS